MCFQAKGNESVVVTDNFSFAKNKLPLENRNSLTRNFQFDGFFVGVNARRRFPLFFLNLDEDLGNYFEKQIGNICQSEQDGIKVIQHKTRQIPFDSEVAPALAVVVA